MFCIMDCKINTKQVYIIICKQLAYIYIYIYMAYIDV